MHLNDKRPLKRGRTPATVVTWSLAAAAGMGVMSAWGRGAVANWPDLESRIQYGYYTEDVRSLTSVAEQLAADGAEDALRSYYSGLANYRLALLNTEADKGRAKGNVQKCVSSLDDALHLRKNFADALALQSACLDMLAGLEAWRAPLAAGKSGAQIEKARHLEPKNPRVLLFDAIGDYDRPSAPVADKERVLGKFKKVAAAFDDERADVEHVPGWGAAEAYMYLARCYLDRGDTLSARDALERALLIAPEYGQARRMMSKFTSG